MRETAAELHSKRVSDSLRDKFGPDARRWKDSKAGYTAIHMWLTKHYKKTSCEHCGKQKNKVSRLEWANISGEYKREREDYMVLWLDIGERCMRSIKFNFVYGIDGEADTYFTKSFTFAEIENGDHIEEIGDNPFFRNFSILAKRQYTGLKDKNKKEIYEGDIVCSDEYPFTSNNKINYHGKVYWWDEETGFYVDVYPVSDRVSGAACGDGLSEYAHHIEIIGNIYQNPELLKEKENG